MEFSEKEFPLEHLLPKKETGAASFLTKYPEYDGRGTIIAILDSGVDPLAPGLQVTSDGKKKIIDRIDGSGAGDVVTSTVVQAVDREITGLSGRKLKIPEFWHNPSGDYHVGLKNLYDLFPQNLKSRRVKEKKEAEWDPSHKEAVAEAVKKQQAFDSANPNPTGNEKFIKEDLDAQVEHLNSLEKNYDDVGPAMDCVVFHDGNAWKACIDTSFQGDLASCKVLGVYRDTHDLGTFGEKDQLCYSVNIHDEGNLLEIVTVCSAHGTHVASIAAACFPDEPEKNGIAPGAQIISITIGDNRLGSMETGTALVRAMVYLMKQERFQVDVINMSYGEHANWTHAGRIGDLMGEVVNKYGITWVCSAGNHGPALSSVNTPPCIGTNSVIGVGAYVSPEMMSAEYSLREKLPGTLYTWSSRGPSVDGDLGVSICAPGGAITSVPNFYLRGSQLMNGTSMAAPHATGCISLLMSGLKAKKVSWSPFSIKRAVENTAFKVDNMDVFSQGHGLLQVERALEHLTSHGCAVERDVRFQVTVKADIGSKGIYIRDTALLQKEQEFTVTVEPFFLNNTEAKCEGKIDFDLRLALTCDATWVKIPKFWDLMFMARDFVVKVDFAGLPPGAHVTFVRAYDVSCVGKGPVFEVPVTVVVPEPAGSSDLTWKNQLFRPGDIQRKFIRVPDDATLAVLSLSLDSKEYEKNDARFVVHAVQLLPQCSSTTQEYYKFFNMKEEGNGTQVFKVKGGRVMELVIAKWWAGLGSVQLSYSLTFRGVKPTAENHNMHAGQGVYRLDVCSALGNEEVAPAITLKHQVQPLRPTDNKIIPLSERDVIPPGRHIYELQLTYNFTLAKSTEVSPNCATLSELLYESEFEAQLWMLFDSNKQHLCTGDAYASKYSVKLEKGDYILRMHVRHEKKELLDKLVDVPVLLFQKLSSTLSLDVYRTHTQALTLSKKITSLNLSQGVLTPLYVAPLPSDKFPKTVVPGQYYSGTISYAKDELLKKVNSYSFCYHLVDAPKKNNNNNGKADSKEKESENKDKEKSKEEEYQEAIRDLKVVALLKLDVSGPGKALYEELRSSYPDFLPVHVNWLQALDQSKERPSKDIIAVADLILSKIDTAELLAYYGIKADVRPDAGKIKSRMEKQKGYLLEALSKKGLALCELFNKAGTSETSVEDIVAVYSEIVKFVEPSDSKVVKFSIQAAVAQGHYGRALRWLTKQLEEKPSKEMEERMIDLYTRLGWTHCVRYVSQSLPVKYPPGFRPTVLPKGPLLSFSFFCTAEQVGRTPSEETQTCGKHCCLSFSCDPPHTQSVRPSFSVFCG